MFKVKIREAAKKAGVKNFYQLGLKLDTEHTGDIKFEVLARRLWNAENVPTLPTLAAVCDALGCELSDLIERVKKKPAKNGDGKKRKTHK